MLLLLLLVVASVSHMTGAAIQRQDITSLGVSIYGKPFTTLSLNTQPDKVYACFEGYKDPAISNTCVFAEVTGTLTIEIATQEATQQVFKFKDNSGNECVSVSVLRRSGGRVFQSWGAERLNALLPMVTSRAEGTERQRGGAERTSWCDSMEEIREIWRCKIMAGFECMEQDFVLNAVCDGEPVELL
ncbi:hypothetical protein WMY93_004280 [Mugilogobius chulae]|uniref:Uncharacterized protein n=1 Tax=Mugilogobius chulae TaxID=88201 RepID=A0AAW0PNM2_9GOBI